MGIKIKNLSIIFALILILVSACSQSGNSGGENQALINKGEIIFQANCASCHMTTSEVVMVGPSMVGLVKRAENNPTGLDASSYIRQSILEPGAYVKEGFQNLMPDTFANKFSDGELDALLAYLMTFE